MVIRAAIVLPQMRPRNHNSGAVLLGRLGDGRDAADEHRAIRVAHMVVDLVAVQALLPSAGIHLEADGAGDLRLGDGRVLLLAEIVCEFVSEQPVRHVVEQRVQRQVDAAIGYREETRRAPCRAREESALVADVGFEVRFQVFSDLRCLLACDQVLDYHCAVEVEDLDELLRRS